MPVRELYSRRVGAVGGCRVAVVVGVGWFFATGSYSVGAAWANWLVFVAATVAVRVSVQVVYNRTRAYR